MRKCRVCSTNMIKRSGKFGEFLCCPNSTKSNNHGTVSIAQASTITVSKRSTSSNLNVDVEVEKYMASEFSYLMSSTDKFLDLDLYDDVHWSNFGQF